MVDPRPPGWYWIRRYEWSAWRPYEWVVPPSAWRGIARGDEPAVVGPAAPLPDAPPSPPPLTAAQLAALREALGHLVAAHGRSLASDGPIIMNHLRAAIDLLRPVAWPGRDT